jgi:ribosomal protein L16 Arg81 hydroxylase
MINEPALRDALLALAEQNKLEYVMLSTMLDELAALRETVRGLDPTFSEVLEQKRKENSTVQERIAILRMLNEIIRRLKAGEVC